MPLRNLAWLLTVPAVVALGAALAYKAPPPDKDYKLVRQLVDVLALVDENYVRELSDDDRQELIDAMIDGGLHHLDPHSEYLNKKRLEQFETDSEGAFGGVGIVLGIDPATNRLKVDHPMPGTPAFEAGVIADDLIVKVGSTELQPLRENYAPEEMIRAIEDAAKLIKGEIGTKVTLTLRRPGRTPTDFEVVLTRARVEIHPLAGAARRSDDPAKWEWIEDPQYKIALIRIRSFSELVAGGDHNGGELQAAIAEIEKAGGRAIVIDLRDNLGGLLDQAVKV
ncbi:MAG TPA: S41 family peptidase, partial [Gemmataceae bacterium]|nr:S41 family peptidase [Gemmataceae bacterium]